MNVLKNGNKTSVLIPMSEKDTSEGSPIEESETTSPYKRRGRWIPLEQTRKTPNPLPGWLQHFIVVLVLSALTATTIVITKSRNKIPGRPAMMKSRAAASSKLELSPIELKGSENKQNMMSSLVERFTGASKTEEKNSPGPNKLKKYPSRSLESGPQSPTEVAASIVSKNQGDKLASPQKKERDLSLPAKAPSPLEKIRTDPNRIYADKQFVVGDLTYELRNISDHGIEIYVQNSSDARRTYYFPKVLIEGIASEFEDAVMSPGKITFGWVIIPNIRKKNKITLEFDAVGGDHKKETMRLKW